MQINKDKIVTFSYVLSDEKGEELERSDGNDPTAYLHGHFNIMPGLESAMDGKSAGDAFVTKLTASEAYGKRRDIEPQRVPIKHLHDTGHGGKAAAKAKKKLKVGSLVKVNTEGGAKDARVVKVGKFNVDVDMNHPLAGIDLQFDITVHDVREATAEELTHGHAHGLGGHHH